MTRLFRPTRLAALAVALAAFVPPASADTLAQTVTPLGCAGSSVRTFSPWLDPFLYTLAPGGSFEEPSTSWTLAGGAKRVAGNEPFNVRAAGDAWSLSIPAGGSATSPAFCVGVLYPTVRFFAVGGGLLSPLRVDATYDTLLGTVTHPVGIIPGSRTWQPTLPQLLVANLTGLTALKGLTSSVKLSLTAVGTNGWNVDDVYVDPWKVT
jgi:hypothetical protein